MSGLSKRSKSVCPWCHTEVEHPCATVRECKVCPEPYTLTPEQAEQFHQAARDRHPLQARPLPIEGDE